MTGAQKLWLDAHPDYQIVGAGGTYAGGMAPGNSGYERMGALNEDGTFHPRIKPEPPALLVGVRKLPKSDQPQTQVRR